MVKNVRYMFDSMGHVGCPEEKVIVLRSFEVTTKASVLLEKRARDRNEMRYVVQRTQQVRRPIWLEERIDMIATRVEFVLVRVDQVGLWYQLDASGHCGEGVRRKHVIVI